MSLVPLAPPQSASGAKTMAQARRLAHRSWFFLHFFVCFVLLFGFNLCLHSYLSSKAPLDHATNQSDNADVDKTATPPMSTLIKSPLQELSGIETGFEGLSPEEFEIYLSIADRATMDVKFFAIPETVYPQSDNSLLYSYVEKQLKSARDVLTEQQAEFVLKLIESGVAQGSMLKKEVGDKGSLRNSVVTALMKEEGGNLHFAMAAVSVQPRLGWRLITKKQRNKWNEVLSRVADTRLKHEMVDMFDGPVGSKNIIRKPEVKAVAESLQDCVDPVGSKNIIRKPEVKAVAESLQDRVVQSLRDLFA